MAPYPEISSYPPLGQITLVPGPADDISFTVHIEWHKVRPEYPFEVELCYTDAASTLHRGQWPTLALRKSASLPLLIRNQDDEYQHVCYATVLSRKATLAPSGSASSRLVFTFKYRVDPFAPWKWIEIPGGISMGEVLLSPSQIDATSCLPKLEACWRRELVQLTSEHALAHELVSSTNIPDGDYQLNELPSQALLTITSAPRYMAITRLEPYWLGATQGSGQFYTVEDALVICYLTTYGRSIALLALNSMDNTYTTFRSGPNGEILVCSRNDDVGKDVHFRCFEAMAESPHSAISAVVAAARKQLVQSSPNMKLFQQNNSHSPIAQPDLSLVDNFSFCTWNALGQDLTAEKILNGLNQLSSAGINISTLLIDDNWQTLGPTPYDYSDSHRRGFADFPANKDIGSFSELIPQIRSKYPSIKYIGVWHALLGYWAGLATNGELTKRYKTRLVKSKLMRNVPGELTIIDPSDIDRFFNDFYSYLKSEGINFVKTDVQHMLDMFASSSDRVGCISSYQSAWTSAYLRNFQGKAISCMSQIPEILFHSMLQDQTPQVLYRNSDDFYPEIPASHPWHVWVNAHNALLTQNLNVVPDWDMFQTSHPYSSYHAAARCISGGPIMITDVPGEHDIELIREMVAESPDGRTIAIRPDVATTINVWDRFADGNVLKIGTTAGPRSSVSLIGLFNVAEKVKHAMVPIGEFPSVEEGVEVLVRSYRTGEIFGPVKACRDCSRLSAESLLQVKLDVRGWEILTAYLVHKLVTKHKDEVSLTILGLMGKMSGGAAVTTCEVQQMAEGAVIKVGLKALGVLGLWCKGPGRSSLRICVEGQVMQSNEKNWLQIGQEEMVGTFDILQFGKDRNLWGEQKEACVEIWL